MELCGFDYAIAACHSDFKKAFGHCFKSAPTSLVDIWCDSLEEIAAGVFISFTVYHFVRLVDLSIDFAVDFDNRWSE